MLIRDNGEALLSQRCTSEDGARYVADGLQQDEINHGAIDASPALRVVVQKPRR